MEEQTKYRDAWANTKQASPQQLLRVAAPTLSAARRDALALGTLIQEISQTTSTREFYAAVEKLTEISRQISYSTHNLKTLCDFQVPPATLFTDHYVNQFFLMSALKRTWWVEGPAFCGLAIKPNSRILELGCGTGYYTEVFFAPFASEIVAIDIDARAIETAHRLHHADNIRYDVMDFRKSLPAGPFDVAIWTPTIFAYSPGEVEALMERLRAAMTSSGRLCGWTSVETDRPGPEVLWYDVKSLAARLNKHFNNVRVFERVHHTVRPPRHVLFFYASDENLPFDEEWPHGVVLKK